MNRCFSCARGCQLPGSAHRNVQISLAMRCNLRFHCTRVIDRVGVMEQTEHRKVENVHVDRATLYNGFAKQTPQSRPVNSSRITITAPPLLPRAPCITHPLRLTAVLEVIVRCPTSNAIPQDHHHTCIPTWSWAHTCIKTGWFGSRNLMTCCVYVKLSQLTDSTAIVCSASVSTAKN